MSAVPPSKESLPAPETDVVAVLVEANGRTECTIFPPGADENDLLTTWITAVEGSFVDLTDWR